MMTRITQWTGWPSPTSAARVMVALVFVFVVLWPSVAVADDESPQDLTSLRIDVTELVPGADLVRELDFTARDISPGDNPAAEINRAQFVGGRGWLYALDGMQISVILLEARTQQAASAFAEAQGTGPSDVAPDAYRGERRSDGRVDLGYSGSVGRMTVYTGVATGDPTVSEEFEADALALRLFVAQRGRLPTLSDLSTDEATAIGRQFGYIWGAVTFGIVLIGVLAGLLLSVLTDRGSREWSRNRLVPLADGSHWRDVTSRVSAVLRLGRSVPFLRGLAVATVAGGAIAAPSLRVWQSIGLVALAVLAWTLVETWLRRRNSRSDLARGGFAIGVTAAGSVAATLVLVAGVTMMSAAAAGVVAQHQLATPVIVGAMVVFGLEVVNWSRRPVRVARRLLQPRVREQIEHDQRAPLLLLRSFQDDSLDVRPPFALTGAIDTFSGEARVRFEEVVAWAAWDVGPLRTFGQPGTHLQPLGAARDYHDDENWQDAIRELADQAHAYVLMAGRSPSLVWEIAEIRLQRRLARTVFVFAPVDDTEAERRTAVLCSALDLDPNVLEPGRGRGVLALGFDSEGSPTTYIAAGRTADAYIIALAEALREVSSAATVGEPAPWARKEGRDVSAELARFDPHGVKKRRSVISWISSVAMRFVPI